MAIAPLVTPRPIPLGDGSFAGVLFGSSQKVRIVTHSGLEESAGVRTLDQDRLGQDGQWSGEDLFGSRTPQIQFVVLGDDPADLRAQLAILEYNWRVDSTEYPLWLYNGTRFLNARVRKRAISASGTNPDGSGTRDATGGQGSTAWVTLQFYCKDPYWYGVAQQLTISPTTFGGTNFTWPIVWPIRFATVSSGAAVASNIGSETTPVRVLIPGPTLNPVIGNDTVGRQVSINAALISGDLLTLDSDLRVATLNGVYRNDLLADMKGWWDLVRGDNALRFSSGSAGAGEHATVVWNPRWQ